MIEVDDRPSDDDYASDPLSGHELPISISCLSSLSSEQRAGCRLLSVSAEYSDPPVDDSRVSEKAIEVVVWRSRRGEAAEDLSSSLSSLMYTMVMMKEPPAPNAANPYGPSEDGPISLPSGRADAGTGWYLDGY
jgi:hypothetical protein